MTGKNVMFFFFQKQYPLSMTSKLSMYFTCHYKQQGKCLFHFWSFIFIPSFFRRSSAAHIACYYMWFSHPVTSNSGHGCISSSVVYWVKIKGTLLEIHVIYFSLPKAYDNLWHGFYFQDELCILKTESKRQRVFPRSHEDADTIVGGKNSDKHCERT